MLSSFSQSLLKYCRGKHTQPHIYIHCHNIPRTTSLDQVTVVRQLLQRKLRFRRHLSSVTPRVPDPSHVSLKKKMHSNIPTEVDGQGRFHGNQVTFFARPPSSPTQHSLKSPPGFERAEAATQAGPHPGMTELSENINLSRCMRPHLPHPTNFPQSQGSPHNRRPTRLRTGRGICRSTIRAVHATATAALPPPLLHPR